MSKEGFENEKDLENALNNKKISEINKNLKKFIISIFDCKEENVLNEIIVCKKIGGTIKSDLSLTFLNKTLNISVKIGTGNSVHQEPLEGFINYLKKDFKDFNENIADDIRFFIWGDKTTTGKGLKNERMSSKEIIENYPERIDNIKLFFNKHIEKLIKRFLLTGKDGNTEIDFIYYGDVNNGYWANKNNLINFALSNKESKNITIGILTFQAWNRNIKCGNSSEKKRGVIQLKWGSIGKNIKNIMENYE